MSSWGFRERVAAAVKTVPAGWLTTYGDVAAAIGSPRAARQVGFALAGLGDAADEVPWWRVINAQGRISGRGEHERVRWQDRLLRDDGLQPSPAGRWPLRERRWRFAVDDLPWAAAPLPGED